MNKTLAGKLALLSVAGMLCGCGTSPPARLYILEPVAVSATASPSPSTLLVNEATLAEHLTRKEILSRDTRYKINAAAFDRWAESLESNITSVVAENLSVLLATDRVISHPWTYGGTAEFVISLHVISFGTEPSGDVVLNSLWKVTNSRGATVALERSRISEPRAGDAVVHTVAAMSMALGQLSKDIAATLQGLTVHAGAGE